MAEAEKVILIVDWENLRNRIGRYLPLKGKSPQSENRKIDFNNPNDIYNLLLSYIVEGEDIFRIMFYVAFFREEYKQKYLLKSSDGPEVINIGKENFKRKIEKLANKDALLNLYHIVIKSEKKIRPLMYKRKVTFREGVLEIKELKVRKDGQTLTFGKPLQKRVDMLMGIDIVNTSIKTKIKKLILLCNDEDILPAIKEAKRNGIYIVLGGLDIELPHLNKKLKEHCDEVRVIDTKDMIQGKAKKVYILSDSNQSLIKEE